MSEQQAASRQSDAADALVERVAQIYATSLLDAGAKANREDEVLQELEGVVTSVLDAFPKFETTLMSGFISSEEKRDMLTRVLEGRVSSLVGSFLKVVADHDRLDCLRAIAKQARRIQQRRAGIVPLELRLASETSEATRNGIIQAVSEKLGIQPQVEVVIDPEILGGFILRLGDTVYDGSVRSQLKRAEGAMVTRSIEFIQAERERLINEATSA